MNVSTTQNRLIVALVALTTATMFFPTAAASGHDNFGTRVELGDNDFTPSLTQQDTSICRIDFGTSDRITDDAFYLDTDDNGDVDTFDIRLTSFNDNDPGTHVSDADSSEQETGACTDSFTSDAQLIWQDIDNDGDLTEEDNLFIGFDGGTGDLDAANDDSSTSGISSSDEFWVRLQPSENKDAGTLVTSGDNDLVNFGNGNVIGETSSGGANGPIFAYFDKDNSANYDDGDWAYFSWDSVPATSGVSTGDLPALYSVRLTHEAEDFGTQVALGDDDFTPTLDQQQVRICRIDFGTSDRITDDAFYLDTDDNGDVDTFDIRLTSFNDNDPGTHVSDADSSEQETGACTDSFTSDAQLIWQDIDNDGDLTEEDNLFIGFDGGTGDLDAANDDSSTSGISSSDEFWVRLQPSENKDAGTLVTSGDNDLVNFGSGNLIGDLDDTGTDGVLGYFDQDSSGSLDSDDWVYLSSTDDVDSSDVPSLYSVRLHGDISEASGPGTGGGDTDLGVTVSSPSDGDTFEPGTDIEVTGTSTAADEVTVTAGDMDLDVSGTDSWNATLEDAPEGEHTITATASDGSDEVTDSVTITVEEEQPAPTVSIDSPSDGEEFTAGDDIEIAGSAENADSVSVSADGSTVDVTGTSTWTGTWTDAQAGTYTITAEATGANGQTATDEVSVTVNEDQSTDDGAMDDGTTDDGTTDDGTTDGGTDDETTDDGTTEETPALGAVAAVALVGLAALLRRD